MRVEIVEESIDTLSDYARVPIAFEVTSVLDVARVDGHFALVERAIDAPYVKDYDTSDGEAPTQWAAHFDLSHWGFFAARLDGRRVGGAAVAYDTPGMALLEGRRDLAVLWDIRVAPDERGHGVGAALFAAAEAWAAARDCEWLKVETQNVNGRACRFYERQGCVLDAVNERAYPELPDETQLIWVKRLLGTP